MPPADEPGPPRARFPLDPDLDTDEDERHRSGHPPALPTRRAARWPRIHPSAVAAVAVGGFFGGLLRHELTLAWPSRAGAFPWSTWFVNTVGALVLALVLVLVREALPSTRYLRALVGTGFCGALTTFGSVATQADQLAAHGQATLAAGYLLMTLAAGLGAAWLGVLLGRGLASRLASGRGGR